MIIAIPHPTQPQAPTANLKRRWLSISEAAAYMGCSRSLLDKDRVSRIHGIPFSKFGRVIRYDIDALDDFLRSKRVPESGQ